MMLSIKNLSICLPQEQGDLPIIRNLSFELDEGDTLGVVGESGSGKSLTNLALMGLLPKEAKVTADKMEFNGHNLLKMKEKTWRKVRGNQGFFHGGRPALDLG